ncbi:hypothetical protein VTN77DRAFT_3430 [Rasamsonia byssochlamydoides]|uniref:uncharacterized protein n=1 Tax=Rasamsonia byssochlamydoides TaxID=89139 RepID=UPI0037437E16
MHPGFLERRERLQDAIEIAERKEDGANNGAAARHEELLRRYFGSGNGKGLHVSRTLDQYYYSSLPDTVRRDADQVVRRYQTRQFQEKAERERERKNAEPQSRKNLSGSYGADAPDRRQTSVLNNNADQIENPVRESEHIGPDEDNNDWDFEMCMVDQLWLWIVDDKTVITCFPQNWGGNSKGNRRPELLDKIRSHIHEEMRPQISSVYHLATLITSVCVGFVEDCHARLPDGPESLFHMFASLIGIVADEEVKCFEAFKKEVHQSNKVNDENGNSAVQGLNLQSEIDLLEEVKDIRDELNILKSICEDQKDLLQKLFSLVAKAAPDAEREAIAKDPVLNYYHHRSDIQLRIERLEKMDMDARITYDALNHLLDLKQKNTTSLRLLKLGSRRSKLRDRRRKRQRRAGPFWSSPLLPSSSYAIISSFPICIERPIIPT